MVVWTNGPTEDPHGIEVALSPVRHDDAFGNDPIVTVNPARGAPETKSAAFPLNVVGGAGVGVGVAVGATVTMGVGIALEVGAALALEVGLGTTGADVGDTGFDGPEGLDGVGELPPPPLHPDATTTMARSGQKLLARLI